MERTIDPKTNSMGHFDKFFEYNCLLNKHLTVENVIIAINATFHGTPYITLQRIVEFDRTK